MDKKVLRERIRKKQQQVRRRKMMRLGACVIAVILVVVFVIRGILIPVVNRISGRNVEKPAKVQAEVDNTDSETVSDGTADTASGTTTAVNSAVRYPLKNDSAKAFQLSIGWNENEKGKWYQNADGTYYANGMQEIDGSKYYFDENGYIQTGWVSVGFDDYYFNDDGTYDPNTHKPRIALTFDDGPGEYTDELLDCLEENNAHATFFMLGQNVGSWQSTVQRMVDIGCEIGNHSWDHPSQTLLNMSMDDVLAEFQKTDDALKEACGQISTVARAPYGAANQDIFDAVQKPFFMWSLDTEDWKLMDADADYNEIIRSVGGIDMQLLGIGGNGHIGFNEPNEAFELGTHCVDLKEETIEANKRFFDGNADLVPKQAYTMGIKTIMQARKVLMVANGKGKADIVKKAFFGPVTPEVPASILQMHPDFILVGDEEALSEI